MIGTDVGSDYVILHTLLRDDVEVTVGKEEIVNGPRDDYKYLHRHLGEQGTDVK